MLLIKCHAIGSVIAIISSPAEVTAYCYLSGEANYPHADFVIHQSCYRLVNVTGIRRKEGAKNDKNFPGAVAWRMTLDTD